MILDAFAGPGGWSEGLRALGLTDIGIEWGAAACATRRAAGHATIRADVETFPLDHLRGRVEGLIMSPPCPDFSTAGKGAGIDGESGRLIRQVPRWVEALEPQWVACEQVPPALPWWRLYAHRFAGIGYSTWSGVLCAADYGVPQTRRRAFLLAHRSRPALPPEPTHAETPGGMFGALRPWVTMAQALGWGLRDEPAVTFCGGNQGGPALAGGSGARAKLRAARRDGRWVLDCRQQTDGVPARLIGSDEPAPTLTVEAGAKGVWCWRRPATTLCADSRISPPIHHDGSQTAGAIGTEEARTGGTISDPIRLELAEALILQGFDPAYPVQGSRSKAFEQVGNAVPVPLAAAVIGALTGIADQEAIAS